MLPYRHDRIADTPESHGFPTIPPSVRLDLRLPPIPVVFRTSEMPWTPVPETTVTKMTIFDFGRTRSGRPGSSATFWSTRKPHSRSATAMASSGLVPVVLCRRSRAEVAESLGVGSFPISSALHCGGVHPALHRSRQQRTPPHQPLVQPARHTDCPTLREIRQTIDCHLLRG